jgi:hypothetical protein
MSETQPASKRDPNPLTRAIHGVDVLGDLSAKRRRYLAPEVLYGCGRLVQHAEQFALGVIFLEAFNGRFTSEGARLDQHDYRRQVDLQDFLEAVGARSPKLERVLRQMVHVSAAKRYPTLGDVLDDVARVPVPGERLKSNRRLKPPAAPAPPPPTSPAPGPPAPPVTVPQVPAPRPVVPSSLTRAERKRLIEILAEQAENSPDGEEVFFKHLLANADLPPKWVSDHSRTVRLSPRVAAQRLIDWAIHKKDHPEDPRLTVLGSLLATLLPELGFSEARYFVAVISRYRLFQSPELLRSLELRYLVPRPAEEVVPETVNLGPDITWCGPAEETIHLHDWVQRPPPPPRRRLPAPGPGTDGRDLPHRTPGPEPPGHRLSRRAAPGRDVLSRAEG